MLRIVLLASLGLAMLAVAEQHKMNMSDVKASRSKHDAVVKDAQEAFVALSKTAHDLKAKRAVLRNHTELESIVDKFYTQAGKDASTKAVLHSVEVAREKQKKELQSLASHAKNSARAVLHTARNVEHVSRDAGVPEHVYEKEYGVAERIGEKLHDQVGDLSEDASEALADVYKSIGAPIEEKLHKEEKAKREAEKKAKREAEKKAKEAAAAKKAEEKREEKAKRGAEMKVKKAAAAKKAEEERKEKSVAKGNFSKPKPNHTALETYTSQQLAAFSARSLDRMAMLGCIGFLSLLAMLLYSQFRRTQPVIGSYPLLG